MQGAHSGAGSTTQRVGDLEALEAVARFGLFPDNVQNGVDELGALRVVSLGPVVTGTGLPEHEVVGPGELTEGPRANGVHGTRLEIHQDGARDVASACGLVVVDVNALELKVGVAVVRARGVNAVLIGNNFPELGADLVSALSGLDVDDFAHG